MMDLDLTGKTAFVGGSSQGIGRAAALELADLGATVVLAARNEAALNEVLPLLNNQKGQKHTYITADYDFPDELKAKVQMYISEHGPIHIVVNNSGGPPPGPVSEAKADAFLAAFRQHLLCNHAVMEATLPGMKKEGYGRFINVISTSVKQPIPGLGVSNTIRAAVANWSKTLSREVAPFGITVNNVLPGATYTSRLKGIIENTASKKNISIEDAEKEAQKEIPAGRFSTPEEVANVIAFLASPAAAYVNGVNIPVDGGRTASL